MHPHWKPLQPLCLWSGYGAGYKRVNFLHFVVYSRPSYKIPLLPLKLKNLFKSNSSSFVSALVLPHSYARVHTHTHTNTHTHTHTQNHGTCSARVHRARSHSSRQRLLFHSDTNACNLPSLQVRWVCTEVLQAVEWLTVYVSRIFLILTRIKYHASDYYKREYVRCQRKLFFIAFSHSWSL
jgi:hypothetical protein